jgi:hypothetical protein
MRHEAQIKELKEELHELREDYRDLNEKFIETIKNME